MRLPLVAACILSLAPFVPPAFGQAVITEHKGGLMQMDEVTVDATAVARGWEQVYDAYSCVYHHRYLLASQYLLYALKTGAGSRFAEAK